MAKQPKLAKPKPTTVDFEGFGIVRRPNYPPAPVGVSIKYWGKPSRYYSWGHQSGNNCTRMEAALALKQAWNTPDGVLFHHGKFDIDCAEIHFGLKIPEWQRTHDTLYLLFLDNPHSKDLGLKTAAHQLLGVPPDEQDAVANWLVANQPVPGVKIGAGKKSKEPAGKYIAYAPGQLVAPYAMGDTDRTEAIFDQLWTSVVVKRKMAEAYDRERRLMPVLLQAERNGVRVDHERLRRDVRMYTEWMAKIDAWVRKQLGNPTFPEKAGSDIYVPLNIDSSAQLAEALIACGKADSALMGMTPTGNVATNKASLAAGVTDKVMAGVLQYRAQLKTCLYTFLVTWLEMADQSDGLIFTTWNQVKADSSDGQVGTRTGRLSSTPNFQNIPKEFTAIFRDLKDALTKHLPKCPWADLPPLPLCRGYIVPYAEGEVLVGRDYSQQEPRILAHFEGGVLQDQYNENPWLDYHDNAKEHLERVMGKPYKRKPVKNINLGIIYGQGLGSLAEKNGSTVEETKEIRDAIYAMYPGLKTMYNTMRQMAKDNEPLITWGSRQVYCEDPVVIRGRMMTFDYKMVNYLVQGSAADCTKEALIRFAARIHNRPWRILLQVHDEIVISVPCCDFEEAMEMLRECMESVEFDVKILSEGAWSSDNWAVMKDYDKKGKIVSPF